MGQQSSLLHKISIADVQVHDEFLILSSTLLHKNIKEMSDHLVQLSFNFFVTPDQFYKLLKIPLNSIFEEAVNRWFKMLRKNNTSKVFNALEFLSALSLVLHSGTEEDCILICFDMFDFERKGLLSCEVISLMLKTCLQGLCKITVSLKDKLENLCDSAILSDFVSKSIKACDIVKDGVELDLQMFTKWIQNTWEIRKVLSILRGEKSNILCSALISSSGGPVTNLRLLKQEHKFAAEIHRITNARQLAESSLKRAEIELEVERRSRERAESALEIAEQRNRELEKKLILLRKKFEEEQFKGLDMDMHVKMDVLAHMLRCSLIEARVKKREGEISLEQLTRNRAAENIQAIYKGYTERKNYQILLRKNRAARRIQKNYRKRLYYLKCKNEHNCAIKIQSFLRGCKGRKIFKERKMEQKIQTNACKNIQSLWRGRKARQRVQRIRLERLQKYSATKMQAIFRKYSCQKKYKLIKQQRKDLGLVPDGADEATGIVQKIVAHRVSKDGPTVDYKVRWKWENENADEWFPREDLIADGGYLIDIIRKYEESNKAELFELLETNDEDSNSEHGSEVVEEECDIEKIVTHEVLDNKSIQFRVRWYGAQEEDDEWFSREELIEAGGRTPHLLVLYEAQHETELRQYHKNLPHYKSMIVKQSS